MTGRIEMDQRAVDIGDTPVRVADGATAFGDQLADVPSAAGWAEAVRTVSDEGVTRIGWRVPQAQADIEEAL